MGSSIYIQTSNTKKDSFAPSLQSFLLYAHSKVILLSRHKNEYSGEHFQAKNNGRENIKLKKLKNT